jgi:hypothetical protein
MSAFKFTDPTQKLLELISNQIELAVRKASFDKDTKDTKSQPKEFFDNQLHNLHSKIMSQRHELGITVEGI